MPNNLIDTSEYLREERKKLNEERRARWRSVNYGETDSNLAKYARQVESFGRIRYW